MKYTVLTLFPDIIEAFFATSIMAKAVERGHIAYRTINIRDFALDKHHKCDDAPYGGGAGMLMLPEPLGRALHAAGVLSRRQQESKKRTDPSEKIEGAHLPHVIYLSPSGKLLTQEKARELAQKEELVLICGRYEGIDQRIIDAYVDEELSIGDYVLSSGEVAALVLIDATYRLVEGVISRESLEEESFSHGLLEYPQYTRPEVYDMMQVPEVLLSGHHEQIRRWRLEQQVRKTLMVRPDLIERGLKEGIFDGEVKALIEKLRKEE
ncbi:MAG: tRNA (guanosine(37)-N1)-methyltransferase TrmD [Treponemataceae bacterium]|nr:tRNA (guanosine(37)-N1)-methyltransferase TrmD [Treponemataceae bacterium]